MTTHFRGWCPDDSTANDVLSGGGAATFELDLGAKTAAPATTAQYDWWSSVDDLRILDGTLADGFALTGNATLTWSGTAPTQSRLAFQIKLGTTDEHLGVESATWNEIKALHR